MKIVRPTLVAALLFAAVPAGRAWSSPYPQADAYYTVRDKAAAIDNLVQNFTQQQVQTQPSMFQGKVLEVKGVISAIAGTDAKATVLVDLGNGQTVPVFLPPDRPLSKWTTLDVGVAIRFLCHVVTPQGSSTGELQVAIAVRESEGAALDLARAKAEAEKKQKEEARQALAMRANKKAPAKQLASRGVSRSVTGRQSKVATSPRTKLSNEQLVTAYAEAVRFFNRRLDAGTARRIAQTIISYSVKYDLDARLVMAVIAVESNFNPGAVSPVGAMGLGQLMPGTAGDLGVGNAFSIESNLEGSTRLLSGHIRNMSADGRVSDDAIKLALACYNAGAGAVRKYKGIPPYRETQNYVVKITRLYKQLCGVQ